MAKLPQLSLVIKILSLLVVPGLASTLEEEQNSSYSYNPNEVIQLTSDRRLAFPVGTWMSFAPTISLPMNKDLPSGFSNDAILSLDMSINCDDLGMTSVENTWGRRKREATPSVGNLAGGDREVLYKIVERSLNSVGIDGKACLLRAICEMFVAPLDHHGLVGEMLEVFFSPSRRHVNEERLAEYTEAELQGKNSRECEQYYEACPYSFFVPAASGNETVSIPRVNSEMAKLPQLSLVIKILSLLVLPGLASTLEEEQNSYNPNEVIQLTSDRRLAFPVGTMIVFTPTISLPIDKDLPSGFSNSAALSLPMRIMCDDLGMTSVENTWGRRKREATPSVGNLAGGDREVVYKIVERSLNSVGIDGKACLLRAICEMFVAPLDHHGLVGEMLEVFFSPSRRHVNEERLAEYTQAELQGKNSRDCEQYYEACPYSFFVPAASGNETMF
ncbi:uncharacterized protein [Macrobrachium rosenbergii]|uniref:uncharacterized protein n=1 Tax=Macrobrachium rosenbergii TaxID=79674 RepID=UPI0034D3A45B